MGINDNLLETDIKEILLKEFTEEQINNYLKYEEDLAFAFYSDKSKYSEDSTEANDFKAIDARVREIRRKLLERDP